MDTKKLLDRTGWKLLEALQTDARYSFAELGRMVNLSAPAVAERIRKLEEAGIISGYHTHLNPEKLGYGVRAFVNIVTPTQKYEAIIELSRRLPNIRSLHHIAGGDSFIMEVETASIPALEALIEKISRYGETRTSIVMSTPVSRYDYTVEPEEQD